MVIGLSQCEYVSFSSSFSSGTPVRVFSSLQLIMEMSLQECTILLLFGWKVRQQAVSVLVLCKVAEELEVTQPSTGLHFKDPNQEFITERKVLACLLLEQNAISWRFPRYN